MGHRTTLTKADIGEIDAALSEWRDSASLEEKLMKLYERFGPPIAFEPGGKSWRESVAAKRIASKISADRYRWSN